MPDPQPTKPINLFYSYSKKRATTGGVCLHWGGDGFDRIGWALREGIANSTLRDCHDINGTNGEYFHPYLVKEGKMRGGLEFLTAKPKLRAFWEEA